MYLGRKVIDFCFSYRFCPSSLFSLSVPLYEIESITLVTLSLPHFLLSLSLSLITWKIITRGEKALNLWG